MTVREASCPGCGAALEFRNAATILAVCASCGSASVRGDLRLEFLGKVADLAPILSPLRIGSEGRFEGRSWRAVGRIQIDHGLGPWNEWCLLFADGRWGWLAEAQGETFLTFPVEGAAAPPHGKVKIGGRVFLEEKGFFVAAERGTGTVVAVEGELPVRVLPSETGRYIDLRGPGDGFGTLDYGSEEEDPDVYLGRSVRWDEIGVDPAAAAKPGPLRAVADRLSCPKCGASLELRDPAGALRASCSHCGSLLEAREGALAIVGMGHALSRLPLLPLGSRGTIRGVTGEIVAFLIRSVRADGVSYPWDEYLLRLEGGGYRWLTCSDGHWSFVEPANLAEAGHGPAKATWRGLTFRHFQGGRAVIDHVQGEVYWKAKVGEHVKAEDFVAPPHMLSFETGTNERIASVGTYVDPAEIADAFKPPRPLPLPKGVGPHQRNPWGESIRSWWIAWAALAGAILAMMFVFHVRADDAIVLRGSHFVERRAAAFLPDAGVEPPPGRVIFSDEFTLEREGNLSVQLSSPLENDWLYLDAALVDLDRGDVRGFSLEASFYHGVADGERWSEGSRTDRARIGRLPPGRYALRLEPLAQYLGSPQVDFTLEVRTRTASVGRPLLLALLLGAIPAVVSMLWVSFESRRWQNSDHPWIVEE